MKAVLMSTLFLLLIVGSCNTESMMNPVTIENIDLLNVSDGNWQGEYVDEKSEEMSRVEVKVEAHRIKEITVLERKCTPIGKKGEYIIVRVIKEQSLQVDAVSGATLTSTITLKAIEAALKNGMSL
jgi:uncharacterized protein with FMN-binding domain